MTTEITEQAFLGALLLDTALIDCWVGVMTESDFISPLNQRLFSIIADKHKSGEVIDLVTVREKFPDIKYLTQCVEICEVSSHVPGYAKIIKQAAYERQIVEIVRQGKIDRTEPEQWAADIALIPQYTENQEEYTIVELAHMAHDIASKNKGCAYKFCLPVLQRKTGGFDIHENIQIGGYPSHGKSALATHLSIGFAKYGYRVLFLTAEQSELDMTRNILANICRINTMDFRTGRYSDKDKEKVLAAEKTISEWKFDIRRVTTTADIYGAVKKIQPEIVIIDYLQNIAPPKAGMSSHQRDTDNMGAIQNMTIREPIATITLSQFSRPAEKGKMKRPNMRSFMNSGAIEQKASIALLCWWQARADDIVKRDDPLTPEEYEVNVVKSKMGGTGICKMDYYPENCRFENWTNPAEEKQVWDGKRYEKGNYI